MRDRVPSEEFGHADATTQNDSPQKAALKSSALKFLVAAILVNSMSFLGIIAITPLCRVDHINYNIVNNYFYYYPTQCAVRNGGSIQSLIYSFISSCLIGFGLNQLSQTRPMHASTAHFHCMFVWAIVLASLNMLLLSIFAPISSAGVPTASLGACSPYYQPDSYSYCWYGSGICSQERQIFKDTICAWEKDGAAASYFFMLSNWALWLFTIAQVIIVAKTQYWCCSDCKRDCGECSPCCKPAPEEAVEIEVARQKRHGRPVTQPQTAVNPVVASNPYPSLQQNPVVAGPSEVALWLTNSVQLPQYIPQFSSKGYTQMQAVFTINSEEQLRNLVPDILPGHVALILSSIASLRNEQHARQVRSGAAFATALEGTAVTGAVAGAPAQLNG